MTEFDNTKMKKNVIILTHGWTGSSVFTGLLGKAGYNYGQKTVQKTDYDTHENAELVQLNDRLMKELGYTGNHEHGFSHEIIEEMSARADSIDLTPYKEFVERCQAGRPWIWKDPRLTWTIRVWAKILPLEETAFIILTRDDEQAWISSNLRRHIQSMKFTRDYNHGITSSLKKFLDDYNQDYLEFKFEDLLLQPESTINSMNKFLDINLTMSDVKSVYKYPLYKKTRSFKDKMLALAIYLKNYGERDFRNQKGSAQ